MKDYAQLMQPYIVEFLWIDFDESAMENKNFKFRVISIEKLNN